jgi:hypothetical protein
MPDESVSNLPEASETVSDVLELFKEGENTDPVEEQESEETEETKVKSRATGDDKSEDDDEEEPEIKLDDLGTEEEVELDPNEIAFPVSFKEIEKTYPGIAKKFPFLKAAYARDKAFTDRFADVEDADRAIDAAKTLKTVEETVFGGNLGSVLKVVKERDSKAFSKIVDNLIPQLYEVDQKAYFHISGNFSKNLAAEMYRTGVEENQEAARILYKYVFGSESAQMPSSFSGGESAPDPEAEKFRKERDAYEQSRLSTNQESISTTVDNQMKKSILANIDPNNKMTDYVRRTAVNEVLQGVKEYIRKDKSFTTQLNNLWSKAREQNYSQPALDRIKMTLLGRAKPVLRDLIIKTRTEAMKGLVSRDAPKKEESRMSGSSTKKSSGGSKMPAKSDSSKSLNSVQDVKDFLAS